MKCFEIRAKEFRRFIKNLWTLNMKCFEIAMAGMKTNEVLEMNLKHEMFWNLKKAINNSSL